MFINYDKHNRLHALAESKVSYICNCCNNQVTYKEVVASPDGSSMVCVKCVEGLSKLLHKKPEDITIMIAEEAE